MVEAKDVWRLVPAKASDHGPAIESHKLFVQAAALANGA
jgi:hypothetical protein